ncbi:MAG: nucleoside triphosphate pyrophosphatase [Pseudomonadota bacterium]
MAPTHAEDVGFEVWLASASPRRATLLAQLGLRTRQYPVDVDESVRPGEAPVDYVRRVTGMKLEAAASRLIHEQAGPSVPLLAADTAVVLDGESLGKPRDRAHALGMLRRLSGRAHQVFTHVAVGDRAGAVHQATSVTDVRFRPLDDGELARYWEGGEPHGKAGAYAIQGLGAAFIERIDGSYSGVMGLPLFETVKLLAAVGVHVV